MRRRPHRAITFEDSHWPLLLVRFDGTPDDAEFESYLTQMSAMLARRERHSVVLDARHAHFTPARQRRLQADWLRAHRSELVELCAGMAFIVSSRLFRVVINAVFMLQPPPSPHAVFASPEEAVRWAAAQIGIEVPVSQLVWDPERTTRRDMKRP